MVGSEPDTRGKPIACAPQSQGGVRLHICASGVRTNGGSDLDLERRVRSVGEGADASPIPPWLLRARPDGEEDGQRVRAGSVELIYCAPTMSRQSPQETQGPASHVLTRASSSAFLLLPGQGSNPQRSG